jgi:hypothetical protein
MRRIRHDGILAQYSWLLLVPLCAGMVWNPASRGQEAPANPGLVNVDDEGVFEILLAGRPVGSESFRIHSSVGKVEARGEIHLHVEQNGKTMDAQSFPDLSLDSQLLPVTYTWNQKGSQSSRLEVDFRGKVAKVRYKTTNGKEDNREFSLPPDVMVLDDNVVHHYQLVADRFWAMGGGKQIFPVFVPQEALPSLLTVEDLGNGGDKTAGAPAGFRHLLITTDVTHIDLWLDGQQHLERVSVPTTQLEAVRKR